MSKNPATANTTTKAIVPAEIVNDVESRQAFERFSDASGKYIGTDSLHRVYHQCPNNLALTSSVLRNGLDQFQKTLLGQTDTSGLLTEDDFVIGMQRFAELLSKSDNGPAIVQEIEEMCLQIAGQDPTKFADILQLPAVLNREEIVALMDQIKDKDAVNR